MISEDTKKKRISWKKTSVLPDLRQKAFRIRFLTENGKLYSFWLACDEKGRSDGECAAGYVGETF